MDLYQLVEYVSAIRSELNVVKAKLYAIPSGTFSSVMDSLTETADDRRYSIVGVSQSQGCLCSSVQAEVMARLCWTARPLHHSGRRQGVSGGCFVRRHRCTLAQKKGKWQEKYAAFRVVINIKVKYRILEESIWPEGITVHDWYFKT